MADATTNSDSADTQDRAGMDFAARAVLAVIHTHAVLEAIEQGGFLQWLPDHHARANHVMALDMLRLARHSLRPIADPSGAGRDAFEDLLRAYGLQLWEPNDLDDAAPLKAVA